MHAESEKIGTDDLIYKSTNRDTDREQTYGHKGRERGGGMNWETGTDMYIPLHIKQITTENLLYSTGNSTQCSVVT